MPQTEYEEIRLVLINGGLEITTEFEGRLLGEAIYVDEEQEEKPHEIIRIYERGDEKFVSYMEYSDREDGVWMSKMCVTKELTAAEIKKGLTRESYQFKGLHIQNVPSEILGLAVYRALEKI